MISSPPPSVASGCLPVARRVTSDVPSSVSPLPTAPFATVSFAVRAKTADSRPLRPVAIVTTPVTSVAPRARTTAPMARARRCARIRGLLVSLGYCLVCRAAAGDRNARGREVTDSSRSRDELVAKSPQRARESHLARRLVAAELARDLAIRAFFDDAHEDESALQERQPSHRFFDPLRRSLPGGRSAASTRATSAARVRRRSSSTRRRSATVYSHPLIERGGSAAAIDDAASAKTCCVSSSASVWLPVRRSRNRYRSRL